MRWSFRCGPSAQPFHVRSRAPDGCRRSTRISSPETHSYREGVGSMGSQDHPQDFRWLCKLAPTALSAGLLLSQSAACANPLAQRLLDRALSRVPIMVLRRENDDRLTPLVLDARVRNAGLFAMHGSHVSHSSHSSHRSHVSGAGYSRSYRSETSAPTNGNDTGTTIAIAAGAAGAAATATWLLTRKRKS
jgi:LPXTG-motif cell wall-anchored protein